MLVLREKSQRRGYKKLFDSCCRFFPRLRYPVSRPEDVAGALGIHAPNSLSFEEFMHTLLSSEGRPTRLFRFMDREKAEAAFPNAVKSEKFKCCTLISYYFPEGWMEFDLQFDRESRLRRVYVQHKLLAKTEATEIPLNEQGAEPLALN